MARKQIILSISVVFACFFLTACHSASDEMLRNFLEKQNFDNYVVVKSGHSCGSITDPCIEAIVQYAGIVDTAGLQSAQEDEQEYILKKAQSFGEGQNDFSEHKILKGSFQDGGICSKESCDAVILVPTKGDIYYVNIYKF